MFAEIDYKLNLTEKQLVAISEALRFAKKQDFSGLYDYSEAEKRVDNLLYNIRREE